MKKNIIYYLASIYILASCNFKEKKINESLLGIYSLNSNKNKNIEIRKFDDEERKKYLIKFYSTNLVDKKNEIEFEKLKTENFFKINFGDNYKEFIEGDILTTEQIPGIYFFKIKPGIILNDVIPDNKKKLLELSRKVAESSPEEYENNSFEGWDKPIKSTFVMYCNGLINSKKVDKIVQITKIDN